MVADQPGLLPGSWPRNMRTQFVDQATIKVRSGDGGNGMVAWRREKYEPMGGPAGGNGGRGGHVYLEADSGLNTLLDFRYKREYSADPGGKGGPKSKHGRAADDLVIRVPVGTVVYDRTTGAPVCDLVKSGQKVLVAEGGRGGLGNAQLASPTRRAPAYCQPGQPGIERELTLELRLIADVGIVGLPNAGKSSLLTILTAARPKVADYPFTTLEPKLGVAKTPGGDGYVIADIPGLIEGASEGKGLGHQFLRHIERTRLLIHMVDINSDDPAEDITTIEKELSQFSARLPCLPRIMVFNKTDLRTDKPVTESEINHLTGSKPHSEISCATRSGLGQLQKLIANQLQVAPAPEPLYDIPEDRAAYDHGDDGFSVHRHKKAFFVAGDRIERLLSVTNLKDPESLHHFWQKLRGMGVIDELMSQGAEPGSEVVIGQTSFEFGGGST